MAKKKTLKNKWVIVSWLGKYKAAAWAWDRWSQTEAAILDGPKYAIEEALQFIPPRPGERIEIIPARRW